MKKGITPIISIIMLLIIAIAIVGMAFGFMVGMVGTVTNKAVIISGLSSCASGRAAIFITNAGNGNIVGSDINVVLTKCTGSNSANCPSEADFSNTLSSLDIEPESTGIIKENEGSGCSKSNNCVYDVIVNGVMFKTMVNC